MTQTKLHTYQTTSQTARQELITTGQLGEQILQYIQALKKHLNYGLTDGEAAMILAWPRSTVSARRNDAIKATGHRHITNINKERRKNPTGKTALVWKWIE